MIRRHRFRQGEMVALEEIMGTESEIRIPPEAIRAVDMAEELLGSDLAGIYLFGSAVAGGLRVDSDVDVLAITNRHLSEAVRKILVTRLMEISGRVGNADAVKPLEFTVINLADVVPWRYPPRSEFVYGEWLRAEFEKNRISDPEPDPDLAVVLTKVRTDSITLLGPSARELLDPVPPEDLRRAITDSLPGLIGGLRGDERNVLLTLARMWMTLATGEIVPKDVAAAWAVGRLPEGHRLLLDLARRAYLGECGDGGAYREDEVDALVNYLRQEIAD